MDRDVDSTYSANVLPTTYPQRAGVPVINKTTAEEKKDMNLSINDDSIAVE